MNETTNASNETVTSDTSIAPNVIKSVEPIKKRQTELAKWECFINQKEKELCALLPNFSIKENFISSVTQVFRNNPALQLCTIESIRDCIKRCAGLGLTPDTNLGWVYFIPFSGKCTIIIGYKGLIELCSRAGNLLSIEADIVYEGDEIDYTTGTNSKLIIKPNLQNNNNKIIGAYAVATFKNNTEKFKFMSKLQIDTYRIYSKSDKFWNNHYEMMAKKTVIKRLLHYFTFSINNIPMQQAISLNNKAKEGTQYEELQTKEDQPSTAVQAILNRYNNKVAEGNVNE